MKKKQKKNKKIPHTTHRFLLVTNNMLRARSARKRVATAAAREGMALAKKAQPMSTRRKGTVMLQTSCPPVLGMRVREMCKDKALPNL